MSKLDIPVDVDVLREEIQKTYTDVATPEPELSLVPDATVESFASSR